MATTPVNVDFRSSPRQVFENAKLAGLTGEMVDEVFRCWDALCAWKRDLENAYGALRHLRHHSQGDDPPDVTFVFTSAQVAVELTRFLPEPYGAVEDLRKKESLPTDRCLFHPPMSAAGKSQEEIKALMLGSTAPWADTGKELHTSFTYAEQRTVKKLKQLQRKGIEDVFLLFYDMTLFFDLTLLPLIGHLQGAIRTGRILMPTATQILFHSPANPCQYRSFLIRSDGSLEQRTLGYGQRSR